MKTIFILLISFCSIYIQAQDVYVGKNFDTLQVYESANGARFCIKHGERVYIKDPVKNDAYQIVDGFRSGDIIAGRYTNGLLLYKTPLDGQYYLNADGGAIYIISDKNPTLFALKGKIPNSSFYDNITVNQIKDNFPKMGQVKAFGGFEGTVSHLKSGSIFYCRTSKENWAKLQIISFGDKKNIPSELYIRYTVYHKKTNKIISSSEYTDLFSTHLYDLDKNFWAKWDFHWNVRNDLLFFNANNKKDAAFYLVKEEDITMTTTVVSKPEIAPQQQTVVPIQPISSQIRWTHPYNNASLTNDSIIELSACVETNEDIPIYKLFRNNQSIDIDRGLIPRRDNDCKNPFREHVKLRLGNNEYQLQVRVGKNEIKSEVFRIKYDPNGVNKQKTRRLALVIGNSKYQYIRALANPTNDATAITTALQDIGFDVITVTDADLRKMNEKLDEFIEKLKNYDIGIFYYAGHGLQVDNSNYLVPVNANPKTEGEISLDCFAITRVLARMEAVRNRANIIILDACRDNPFILMPKKDRNSVAPGLAAINNARAGTMISFATAAGKTAQDGTGKNGTYTTALLQHIRNPNLSVSQLFTSVIGTVQTATDGEQLPWTNSSLGIELYLTR